MRSTPKDYADQSKGESQKCGGEDDDDLHVASVYCQEML